MMTTLTGPPEHLGRLWGEINGADIRVHLGEFYDVAKREHGLSEAVLLARAQAYEDLVADLAPHWHAEARAVAEAAGVDVGLYNAFLAGRYRGLLFHEECTSYAAVGSAPSDGRPLFHKNRDNRMRRQAFYRKEMVGGPTGLSGLPYIALGDTSDTGVMMMVNAAGLAGSADMGGSDPRPHYRGLMNPYGLRLIAEQATTCAEALDLVREMTVRGQYAGGSIATRWTFADRHGRTVVALNTHEAVVVEADTTDGVVQSCPRQGLAELLAERQGQLTVEDFNTASRLPGVCVRENCSSLTVLIDPARPDLFTCAWAALGRAQDAPYVPLYMGTTGTPRAYLDGTVYSWSERGLPPEVIAHFEMNCTAFRVQAEAAARTALSVGREEAAQARLAQAAEYAAAQGDNQLVAW